MLAEDMKENATIPEILKVLTDSQEYHELPVRHNEDIINKFVQ